MAPSNRSDPNSPEQAVGSAHPENKCLPAPKLGPLQQVALQWLLMADGFIPALCTLRSGEGQV